MRIIAGRFRGRKLKAPKGLATRPVLGRVREALFNILGDMNGTKVLDCFAGTGAVGIEALSRGAESAVFLESGALQCGLIRDNLAGAETQASIIRADAIAALKKFARSGTTFDFIFADPPYDMGLSQKTVDIVCSSGVLSRSGILALTVRSSEILPESSGGCEIVDERRYGDTKLVMYAFKREE